MSKKTYLSGLTTVVNKFNENNFNQNEDFSNNPSIILSEFDTYQTNYNYSQIENNEDKNILLKYEFSIINSLKTITKNYKDVCEKLYQAHALLANHENGVFVSWFTSMNLDKSFVYRCLDRYNVYLETKRDVFLSQGVPIRTIQLVKKADGLDAKIKVAELLEYNHSISSSKVKEYLNNNDSHIENISVAVEPVQIRRSMKIKKTDNRISINLDGKFSDEELQEISTLLTKYIHNK